jgi:hypothetical protein
MCGGVPIAQPSRTAVCRYMLSVQVIGTSRENGPGALVKTKRKCPWLLLALALPRVVSPH